MLQYIKKYIKGWFLGIILFLIFLSFTFWGVGDIFSGGKSYIVKVGKNKIPIEYFQAEFQTNVGYLNKKGKLDRLELKTVAQETLKNIVTRYLIVNAANSMNISISDNILKKKIFENELFKNKLTNEFDNNIYKNFVSRSFGSEINYLEYLETQIIVNLISDYYEKKISYPKNLTNEIYNQLEEKRSFQIASVDKNFLRSSKKNPEKESLKKFFDKDKKKYFFGERRSFTYLFENLDNIKDKIEVGEEEIIESYNNRKLDFSIPEKRQVEQLVFNNEILGKEILTTLNKDTNLNDLAKKNEKEITYINLGFVEKKQLFDEFSEPVFKLNLNEITDVIKTDIGWHILKVTEIKESTTKKIEDVKKIISDDIALNKSYDELDNILIEVENYINDGNELENISEKLNIDIEKKEKIEKDYFFSSSLPDDLKIDLFFNEVFNGKKNSDLFIQEVENGFFVVRVDKIFKEQQMTFDEAYNKLLLDFQEIQITKKIKEINSEFKKKSSDNIDFNEISDSLNMNSRTTKKLNREDLINQGISINVTQKVFDSKIGTVHEDDTKDQFSIVKVISDSEVTFNDEKFNDISNDVNKVYGIDNFNIVTNILEKKFPVKINENLLNEFLDRMQY